MRIPFRHGQTVLQFAAERNWKTLCRWLLRFGTDINSTDVLGRTALHYAAQADTADAARVLIANGADLHAKDWKERIPLDLADAEGSTAKIIREEISLRSGQRIKHLKTLLNQDR